MFFLGHLGIGSKLVSPFTKGLPRSAVLIGTVLPDLIDKPLYYGLAFFTGKKGAELGLISGTRTFGHTAGFLLILTFISLFKKSKYMAALSLGVAAHLLLDSVFSTRMHQPELTDDTMRTILLWPFLGWNFPTIPYKDLGDQLSFWNRPVLLWGEIIGALFLLLDYARSQKKLPGVGPELKNKKRRKK